MVLYDSKVHLAVADHGEDGLCRDLGDFAVVPKAEVLQIELLLVDCRRSQYGRIDALVEPPRGDVAGVADLLDAFHLVAISMRLSIAQGDIASDLLPVCKLIGSGDLPVAESRPAGIQPQGLGQQDNRRPSGR